MAERQSDATLDQLFRTARTRNGWTAKAMSEALVREVYELAKWGPTSANCCPARFVFVSSDVAKATLATAMSSANRPKVLAAPVTVIMAYDLNFATHLPRLFPHAPTAKDWFADPAMARETAFRNGSLQAAYLMLAARALGLDCGPMSGFKADVVKAAFLADTTWEVNFVCTLGYGSDENLFPRNPRLAFEEVCRIV